MFKLKLEIDDNTLKELKQKYKKDKFFKIFTGSFEDYVSLLITERTIEREDV